MKRSVYVWVHVKTIYLENFTLLIVRILKLPVKIVFFFKCNLLFNIFYCFSVFVNNHFRYLRCEFYVKTKIFVDFQNCISVPLKIVSEIMKSFSSMLNIMIRNYQKNFGKSKSAMEHQKLHGKLPEYTILPVQTISTAFYVQMRNTK